MGEMQLKLRVGRHRSFTTVSPDRLLAHLRVVREPSIMFSEYSSGQLPSAWLNWAIVGYSSSKIAALFRDRHEHVILEAVPRVWLMGGVVQYLLKALACSVVPIAGCGGSGQGWMRPGCNMHICIRQRPAWVRFGLVCRSRTQLIFCWANFTINCRHMVICLSFLPLFPLFLSSLLSSYISSALSVEPSLLSPVSPVLCQSVSNLQLLRLFSSLLPLGSVSGTVSLFFYLFTLPFPSLFLHSALPTHLTCSVWSIILSFCLPVLLAHTFLPWGEVLGSDHLALPQIKVPLTCSVDLGPRHLLKALGVFPGVIGKQWAMKHS